MERIDVELNCTHDIVIKYGVAECQNCGLEESKISKQLTDLEIEREEPKNICPKCRTTDFETCHSIKCPMRKEEPEQEMKDNFQELFDYCYNELGSTPLLTQMYDIISIAQKTNRRSTERKDRNGVEIFEGDYLVDRYEDSESLYKVVYCPRLMAWAIDTSYAKDGSCTESIHEFFGDCLEVKNPLPLTCS